VILFIHNMSPYITLHQEHTKTRVLKTVTADFYIEGINSMY